VGAAQILMLEFSGMEEPIGGLGAEVDKDVLAAASKLAEAGRFQTARAADDLAVGVAEWLADSDGKSGFVRGGSWKSWAAWTGGDALLVRREVALDARADDIGFRVFLEDASSRPAVDLNEMVAAGDWEGVLTHVGRVRRKGRTPVERWAAGSVEDVLSPSPITESRGGDQYARVLWPMSAENAQRFCQRIGGELAVPRNPDELKWLRRKFCRPNGFAAIWISPGRLALPWPAEEVDAGDGERHAFVVRWRKESSVAGAPLQEPQ
jgi:hypothetical protein